MAAYSVFVSFVSRTGRQVDWLALCLPPVHIVTTLRRQKSETLNFTASRPCLESVPICWSNVMVYDSPWTYVSRATKWTTYHISADSVLFYLFLLILVFRTSRLPFVYIVTAAVFFFKIHNFQIRAIIACWLNPTNCPTNILIVYGRSKWKYFFGTYTNFSLNLFAFESSVDEKLPAISDVYFFILFSTFSTNKSVTCHITAT